MWYLLIVSVIWAFSFGLIKKYLPGVDPNLVAFLRLALASLLFLPFLRRREPGPALRLRLLLLGGLQFGVMYVAYLASYRYLQAYQVAVFTIITPFYVTLLDGLLERRLAPRAHLAALLAIAGAGVIAWPHRDDPLVLRGVLILQAANLAFALGQVLYRRLRRDAPDLADHRAMGWMYLGGMTLCLGAAAFTVDPGQIRLTTSQLLVVLYLGLLASGLCFFLWNRGATRVDAGTLGAFNNGYIPLAVLFSLLFFDEQADLQKLAIGSLFIVMGIGLNARRPSARRQDAFPQR